MNKKTWIIITIIVVLLIGMGIFLYFKDMSSHKESNYTANKTSIDNTTIQTENNINNTTAENKENTNTTNEVTQGITETEKNPPTTEEQIATFTTKIYSNDTARQNNISITCNTLNGTIVKNGETFSFCNTIGPSSTSKGYQKADIYDKNGNKKKGLGGRKLSNQYYLV